MFLPARLAIPSAGPDVFCVNKGRRIVTSLFRSARAAFAPLVAVALLSLFGGLPAAANPLAPIWTGAYIGVHGGANWADIDVNTLGSFDTAAATGGLHAGYNIGLGGLVVGVEGDASYNGTDIGISTAGGGSANLTSDWSGTIRGRLGMTIGPALLYATAGYAWSETTLTARTATGTKSSSSDSFDGVVYGIGAESYVLPNISLRLEALRYDYGSESLSVSGAGNALQEIDASDTVVRAGITFHLN
jgi:outer membrane immunogenic protein